MENIQPAVPIVELNIIVNDRYNQGQDDTTRILGGEVERGGKLTLYYILSYYTGYLNNFIDFSH